MQHGHGDGAAQYRQANPLAKEAACRWSKNDEIIFAKSLLNFFREGVVDMAAVYEGVKDRLQFRCKNADLYEKMRLMKSRYSSIQIDLEESGTAKEDFCYSSSHEKKLFKIWEQLWGPGNGNEAAANGRGREVEETRRERKKRRRKELFCKVLLEEKTAMLNRAEGIVAELIADAQSKLTTWIGGFSSGFASCNRGVGSADLPNATLEQRWREQRSKEIELICRRFSLLQEECEMRLKELASSASQCTMRLEALGSPAS